MNDSSVIKDEQLTQRRDFTVFEDGQLTHKSEWAHNWNGLFSSGASNGSIIKYIRTILPKNTIFLIPHSDGNFFECQIPKQIIERANETNKILMVGVIGQSFYQETMNYVYLPLDDRIFDDGIINFLNKDLIPWNERSNQLFWRGACSGFGENSIRIQTTKSLFNRKDSNVRLVGRWKDEKNIPECYFGEICNYTEFMKYKIHFIIDGHVISSMHMFGFASGGVPFLISNAKCWFSDFIIPNVHYIPIKYDLSDLHEKIDWVKNNDKEAEQIANNALEFSKTHFTPEFQRKYLKDTIDRYCNKLKK